MSCLALEVSAGDQVIYTGAGSDMPATVQAMDVQYWYAPGYLSRTLCISQTLVSQSLAQGEGSCRVGGKSLFEDHVHRLRKLVVGCRQMREWEFASHAGLRRMYLPWKMGVSGTLVQSPFVYPHQHHARSRCRFLLLKNHVSILESVIYVLPPTSIVHISIRLSLVRHVASAGVGPTEKYDDFLRNIMYALSLSLAGCQDPSPGSSMTDAYGPAHPTDIQGGFREESVGALGPTQAPVRPSHGTSSHPCPAPVTDVKFHGVTATTSQAPQVHESAFGLFCLL
jgi:hypothetical protein